MEFLQGAEKLKRISTHAAYRHTDEVKSAWYFAPEAETIKNAAWCPFEGLANTGLRDNKL